MDPTPLPSHLAHHMRAEWTAVQAEAVLGATDRSGGVGGGPAAHAGGFATPPPHHKPRPPSASANRPGSAFTPSNNGQSSPRGRWTEQPQSPTAHTTAALMQTLDHVGTQAWNRLQHGKASVYTTPPSRSPMFVAAMSPALSKTYPTSAASTPQPHQPAVVDKTSITALPPIMQSSTHHPDNPVLAGTATTAETMADVAIDVLKNTLGSPLFLHQVPAEAGPTRPRTSSRKRRTSDDLRMEAVDQVMSDVQVEKWLLSLDNDLEDFRSSAVFWELTIRKAAAASGVSYDDLMSKQCSVDTAQLSPLLATVALYAVLVMVRAACPMPSTLQIVLFRILNVAMFSNFSVLPQVIQSSPELIHFLRCVNLRCKQPVPEESKDSAPEVLAPLPPPPPPKNNRKWMEATWHLAMRYALLRSQVIRERLHKPFSLPDRMQALIKLAPRFKDWSKDRPGAPTLHELGDLDLGALPNNVWTTLQFVDSTALTERSMLFEALSEWMRVVCHKDARNIRHVASQLCGCDKLLMRLSYCVHVVQMDVKERRELEAARSKLAADRSDESPEVAALDAKAKTVLADPPLLNGNQILREIIAISDQNRNLHDRMTALRKELDSQHSATKVLQHTIDALHGQLQVMNQWQWNSQLLACAGLSQSEAAVLGPAQVQSRLLAAFDLLNAAEYSASFDNSLNFDAWRYEPRTSPVALPLERGGPETHEASVSPGKTGKAKSKGGKKKKGGRSKSPRTARASVVEGVGCGVRAIADAPRLTLDISPLVLTLEARIERAVEGAFMEMPKWRDGKDLGMQMAAATATDRRVAKSLLGDIPPIAAETEEIMRVGIAKLSSPAAGLTTSNMSLVEVQNMIAQIYCAKDEADSGVDREGLDRMDLASFTSTFFVWNYGLKSLASTNSSQFTTAVKVFAPISARCRVFSWLVSQHEAVPVEAVSSHDLEDAESKKPAGEWKLSNPADASVQPVSRRKHNNQSTSQNLACDFTLQLLSLFNEACRGQTLSRSMSMTPIALTLKDFVMQAPDISLAVFQRTVGRLFDPTEVVRLMNAAKRLVPDDSVMLPFDSAVEIAVACWFQIQARRIEQLGILFRKFASLQSGLLELVLTTQSFTRLFQQIDPTMTTEACAELFAEYAKGSTMTESSFLECLLGRQREVSISKQRTLAQAKTDGQAHVVDKVREEHPAKFYTSAALRSAEVGNLTIASPSAPASRSRSQTSSPRPSSPRTPNPVITVSARGLPAPAGEAPAPVQLPTPAPAPAVPAAPAAPAAPEQTMVRKLSIPAVNFDLNPGIPVPARRPSFAGSSSTSAQHTSQ